MTNQTLSEWQGHSSSVIVKRLDNLVHGYPNRCDRIAFARNVYLQELNGLTPGDYPLTLILDLDGPNDELDPEVLIEQLVLLEKFDAIFANQRQAYYDIFALRHDVWCPSDFGREIERSVSFPFRNRKLALAVTKYIHDRQFCIPPSTPAIPVRSAFGGLGIYRTDILERMWYGSRDETGRVICEHVVLHEQLTALGRKLAIVPGLLNDAPKEHLGLSSGKPFPENVILTKAA